MADDGFREIQLNGKQLIFLFMATTIVAVVIFLCGVKVGRGVRNATAAAAGSETAGAVVPAADIAAVQSQPKRAPAAAPPVDIAPPTPAGEEAGTGEVAARGARPAATRSNAALPASKPAPNAPPSTPPAASGRPAPASAPPTDEALRRGRPATGKPPVATPAVPGSARAATPSPLGALPALPASKPATAKAGAAVPASEGYPVQVAAVGDRAEAESIAKRLQAKGYSAYVMDAATAGGMYRVRVGPFKDLREAQATRRRLEKEEQLKGLWIPPTR